ncbi:MAG TPA: permease-like cell division protein FtsX [Niabella sp.]|nr:permease-like cell division protein FtsX [Niabella sp.]HOZ96145.1 permease-like cell division protein FtsX [Niabella sp.]HQW13511.1 permease-like cell division protein FtsX [Niabella sp.]HQX18905.1 permease-like cell division protein FtsX [Niabella sp.]HQX41807.1 permease-like cell division protein FtsX [Niabella sp.]
MAEKTKIVKRGKASYFMAILGVTLVLFLLGVIGWLVINTRTLGQHFKEEVEVNVYLRDPLVKADSTALVNYIASKSYIKEYVFTTKEMAKAKYLSDGNESWEGILSENPLPQSIDFRLKSEYLNVDTLKNIKADLEKQTYVTEVKYPELLVGGLDSKIKIVNWVLLGISLMLLLAAIGLIDNTIRLAMFSNRFIIKTMQMVGATRWFITKPLDLRAILNGSISAAMAIIGVMIIVRVAKNMLPELAAIQNNEQMIWLYAGMLLLGILITLISTHTSALKYLKKKLDDLY